MMENNLEKQESSEKSKHFDESMQNQQESILAPTASPAENSPETECAICLGHCTNKSFIDCCNHTFCYTCLVDWSKVKTECPFCSRKFESIVYNVRSSTDYDRYYVNKSNKTEDIHAVENSEFPTTLAPEQSHDNSRVALDSYLSHRMRFAPHTMQSFIVPQSGLMSPRRIHYVRFRERIYNENLWISTQNAEHLRSISPHFYRQCIGRTHRLLPFLNRELTVVMSNNENQAPFVIELIMDLILKYEIRSQEFYTHIEPYTAPHTAHFIHEFYNFAVSPYETLESYDQHAKNYVPAAQLNETVSTPYNDVVVIPMDYSNSPLSQITCNESSVVHKQKQPKNESSKGCKKHKKCILKKNSRMSIFRSSLRPSVLFSNSTYAPNPTSVVEGPSTSNVVEGDDEIKVINALNSICRRTLETVNLSSDDELANIVGGVTVEDALISSDDECEIVYFKESNRSSENNSNKNA